MANLRTMEGRLERLEAAHEELAALHEEAARRQGLVFQGRVVTLEDIDQFNEAECLALLDQFGGTPTDAELEEAAAELMMQPSAG